MIYPVSYTDILPSRYWLKNSVFFLAMNCFLSYCMSIGIILSIEKQTLEQARYLPIALLAQYVPRVLVKGCTLENLTAISPKA